MPQLRAEISADAFDRCRPALRRFAVTLVGESDADDLVQDTLERGWRKWRLFDPARGSVQAWLLGILANQARGRLRRARPPWSQLRPDVLVAPATGSEHLDLARAVEHLPSRQRASIVLYYYIDLPIKDVAAVMQCSEGTVKSTLHDARTNLEHALGDSYAHH